MKLDWSKNASTAEVPGEKKRSGGGGDRSGRHGCTTDKPGGRGPVSRKRFSLYEEGGDLEVACLE